MGRTAFEAATQSIVEAEQAQREGSLAADDAQAAWLRAIALNLHAVLREMVAARRSGPR